MNAPARRADPEFEAFVARAKAVPIMTALERCAPGHGKVLKRSGSEWTGPCPRCGGRDRFGVNIRKNEFLCRRCPDMRGGVLSLVLALTGGDFLVACEALTGEPRPARSRAETAGERAERERRIAQERLDAEKRAEKQAEYAEKKRQESIRDARALLRRAKYENDSAIVTRYLCTRGLRLPTGADLWGIPALTYWYDGAERGAYPVMIGAVRQLDGSVTAVHRTFIDPETMQKAVIRDPATGAPVLAGDGRAVPAKKMLGSKGAGHIRLRGPRLNDPACRKIICGEGIETTLSVGLALVKSGRALEDTALIAGLDLGHMRNIAIPDHVEDITWLGDGDSERAATERKLMAAIAAHERPCRVQAIAWAPDGTDFNDVLRGDA